MGLHTRLTDLPVTGGSHVSHTILLDRSRPSKHFGVCARIELWCGVRDRFSTASATSAVYETASANCVWCICSVHMPTSHQIRFLERVREILGWYL